MPGCSMARYYYDTTCTLSTCAWKQPHCQIIFSHPLMRLHTCCILWSGHSHPMLFSLVLTVFRTKFLGSNSCDVGTVLFHFPVSEKNSQSRKEREWGKSGNFASIVLSYVSYGLSVMEMIWITRSVHEILLAGQHCLDDFPKTCVVNWWLGLILINPTYNPHMCIICWGVWGCWLHLYNPLPALTTFGCLAVRGDEALEARGWTHLSSLTEICIWKNVSILPVPGIHYFVLTMTSWLNAKPQVRYSSWIWWHMGDEELGLGIGTTWQRLYRYLHGLDERLCTSSYHVT